MPTRRGVARSASKPLSLRPAWAPGGCDDDDDDEDGDGDEDDDDDDDDNHFVDQAHLDGEQAPIFPKWVSWVQQLAKALSGHLDFDCQVFRSPRLWSGDYSFRLHGHQNSGH